MSEQYRSKKIVHTQNEYGIREKAVDFPMMCNLNFAFACNSQCPNCPFTNSDIRKKYKDALFMDEATFHKIADEAGQYGAFLRLSGTCAAA